MSLPNFMCIGAAKSGTTTLYDILKQHPEVYIPSFKEPHFFDIPDVYTKGLDWYEKTYFKSVKTEKCIGDFTPSYFYEKQSAERIFQNLGKELKFIVILRNPVDRAYSHYLHSVRDERESLTFTEAVNLEKERLKSYSDKEDYLNNLRHSYIAQGQYGKMLQSYLKHFPIDNFLFIHFEEDFIQNRKQTIDEVYDFLKLDKSYQFDINIKSNPASRARSKAVKRLMQKTGWWRKALKSILPSQFVQIIKNKLQRANISSFTPESIDTHQQNEIFNKFFAEDIKTLEQSINRRMNW